MSSATIFSIIITTILCLGTFVLLLGSVVASCELRRWDPAAVVGGIVLAFVAGCALVGTCTSMPEPPDPTTPSAQYIYQGAQNIGRAHGVSAEKR